MCLGVTRALRPASSRTRADDPPVRRARRSRVATRGRVDARVARRLGRRASKCKCRKVLARRSTRGMVAILVVSVCSIRVIRTYTRSIKVCLCGDDAGEGRGAPPDGPICGMGKLEEFSAYCTRWFPMNTKLSRRPCPARARVGRRPTSRAAEWENSNSFLRIAHDGSP